MTALILTAALATAPTLPVVDGIDQDATARGALLEQIIDHQEYTEHMREVWRHRRMEAKRAATVIETQTTNEPVTDYNDTGGWADELAAVGFPPEAIPTMLYIIDRESGGDPNAVNSSSGACGLTQLYPCYGGSAWLDPMTNLHFAYQKYEASGFAPWAL